MKSMFSGMGYLLANSGGPRDEKTEADMLACGHCQIAMPRKLWADDGGFCHHCDLPTCGPCSDKQLTEGCANFRRELERALDRAYHRQQFAKVAGI